MARQISVSEAKPGMVLAKPLADEQGRVLVGQGTRLSPIHISRLRKWGVPALFVEDSDQPAVARPGTGRSAQVAGGAAAADADSGGRPPGVYGGPDLAERISRTFSEVGDDPVMARLRDAVRKRLLVAAPAEESADGD